MKQGSCDLTKKKKIIGKNLSHGCSLLQWLDIPKKLNVLLVVKFYKTTTQIMKQTDYENVLIFIIMMNNRCSIHVVCKVVLSESPETENLTSSFTFCLFLGYESGVGPGQRSTPV